jgi:hypothetical protein
MAAKLPVKLTPVPVRPRHDGCASTLIARFRACRADAFHGEVDKSTALPVGGLTRAR